MSSKKINRKNQSNSRTYYNTSKKRQTKKKKSFNYPKKKTYSEEAESPSSKYDIENKIEDKNSNLPKNKLDIDIVLR